MYPTTFSFGVLHLDTYVSHHGTFIIATSKLFLGSFIPTPHPCTTLLHLFPLVQLSSVGHSSPTLCNPMNHSTPGLPVHPKFTQAQVYRFSDAIQPSILCSPLLIMTPFPPSIWVFLNESTLHMSGQRIGVSGLASVFPLSTQDWFPLGWTGWTSLQSKGLSRVWSITAVQMHQFSSTQLSSQSNSNFHTWSLEKPDPWLDRLCWQCNATDF